MDPTVWIKSQSVNNFADIFFVKFLESVYIVPIHAHTLTQVLAESAKPKRGIRNYKAI